MYARGIIELASGVFARMKKGMCVDRNFNGDAFDVVATPESCSIVNVKSSNFLCFPTLGNWLLLSAWPKGYPL